jgi:hypothetical protein
MRAARVVDVAEFHDEMIAELAVAATLPHVEGVDRETVPNLYSCAAQSRRPQPVVADVKFVSDESRHAFGFQAHAKHVRLPRVAKLRDGR